MIVVYAQGGGLGHLTRARAAAHTLGWEGRLTLLTSSPFAADPRVVGDADVVSVAPDLAARPEELRGVVREVLHDLAPTELVVDAFPDGIAGELDATVVPTGVTVTHLARLLRWERYREAVAAPPDPIVFDRTFVVEPLHAAHAAALAPRAGAMTPLALTDPPATADATTIAEIEGAWLVVHAGPEAEVAELLAYARDQADAEGVDAEIRIVDATPTWPLFPHAARVYTGAGFNAMRQLAPHRDRHRYLPFPRRFDDQPERARRARTKGA